MLVRYRSLVPQALLAEQIRQVLQDFVSSQTGRQRVELEHGLLTWARWLKLQSGIASLVPLSCGHDDDLSGLELGLLLCFSMIRQRK